MRGDGLTEIHAGRSIPAVAQPPTRPSALGRDGRPSASAALRHCDNCGTPDWTFCAPGDVDGQKETTLCLACYAAPTRARSVVCATGESARRPAG